MKLSHKLTLMIAIGLVCSSASALTDLQKGELYEHGTISVFNEDGSKKGHFEVNFMPGAENIKQDAVAAWTSAYALLDDLVERTEFWENKVVKRFKKGVRYMTSHIEDGVCKIDDDFRDTVVENHRSRGSWGHIPVSASNWLKFGAKAVGRTFITGWGIGAGAVYAVAAPTGTALWRPIGAGSKALVKGTLWPAFAFAWNGAAYAATSHKSAPAAGDMTVTFVPEELGHDSLAL